jgi:hypothetical protein
MPVFPIVVTARELAVPTIAPDQWCHPECHAKWKGASSVVQSFLGGHIHFDSTSRSWRMPTQPVPVRNVGRFVDGEIVWFH